MNILILSWRGPGHPNFGGAEVVTHEYAKGWVEAGHKVTLFTSMCNNLKENEIIDGVKIIRKGNQIFGVQIHAFFWYLFGKNPKFDLVFDHFHGLPFFSPIYIRVKKIAFIHEVAQDVWRLNPWPRPFNLVPAVLGVLFEPFIFKFFYTRIKFWTVSKSTKNELVDLGVSPKNVIVINNGVNVTQQPNVSKDKIPVITFLGALSADKGAEDVIETFKLINEGFPEELKYWIIGKGDGFFLDQIKRKIKKYNLEDKIRLWGFVPNEKKFELLKKSFLLINPSVKEGWGLVVIEAAAMGTPTIGYNVAGLRDSIVDNKTGLLVADNSPKELSAQVQYLLKNPKEYQKLVKNAIEWSKQFTWKKAIGTSLDLIEKQR